MTVSPRTSKSRQPALHAQRQRADGARVFGDVFAHRAVAARDRLREAARRGSAPPWKGRPSSVRPRSGYSAPPSSSRTRRSKSRSSASLSALSRLSMGELCAHLDEAFARLAAHALGGRIGREQLGMLRSPGPASWRISASYSASVISGRPGRSRGVRGGAVLRAVFRLRARDLSSGSQL